MRLPYSGAQLASSCSRALQSRKLESSFPSVSGVTPKIIFTNLFASVARHMAKNPSLLDPVKSFYANRSVNDAWCKAEIPSPIYK